MSTLASIVALCFSILGLLTPGTGVDAAVWATASGVWLCLSYIAKRDEEGKR